MTSSVESISDLEMQAPPPKKKGCCTKVNISVGLIETTTAIIAIACFILGAFSTSTYLKSGSYTVGGLAAAAFAGAVFVHICWKRDADVADLHRVNQEIDHTVDKIEDTTKKVDEAADKLKKENQNLTEANKQLTQANADLIQAQLDLDGQVSQLKETNEKIDQENQKTQDQNAKLHEEIGQLTQVINAIQEHLAQYNGQNKKLKKDVGKFSEVAQEFGKTDENLQAVLLSVDKELDIDIAALGKQLDKAETTSQEIFGLFAKQIESLKGELATLNQTVQSVDKNEDDIRARTKELADLQAQIEESDQQLAARKEEFDVINQEIATRQSLLKTFMEQMNASDSKQTHNNEQFHELNDSLASILASYSKLADRIGQDVDKMAALKAKDREQEEEIDQL